MGATARHYLAAATRVGRLESKRRDVRRKKYRLQRVVRDEPELSLDDRAALEGEIAALEVEEKHLGIQIASAKARKELSE